MKKYQNFLSENFPFLVVNFSVYLNRRVFVMIEIPVFDANSVDPNLGLYCFPMSLLWDARLKWVKISYTNQKPAEGSV